MEKLRVKQMNQHAKSEKTSRLRLPSLGIGTNCRRESAQRPERPADPLPPWKPLLGLLPPPCEPPLVNTGRDGWRPAGALKRGALKLDRAGIGRPASEPESYKVEESCRGLFTA